MHRAVILAALSLSTGAALPALAQDAPSSEPVAICYYAGEEYSQWAELPNGQICQPSGTWSYPEGKDPAPDAPPAG